MKKQLLYLLAVTAVVAMVFVTGCQKETSFEGSNNPAKGSLQADATGDCLPKTVNGIYAAGTPLVPGTNTITVQVNVTQTGSYAIGTDTVNGYFFRGTGIFTSLGANTITLRGNGTPFTQGINNFVVSFDGTVCDIAVTVLPAGAGAAVFTLTGSPSCTTPTINGTYTVGVPLDASNTVILNVVVTTAGSYNITTAPAVGGMIFSGSGALAVGNQTITLTGSGNPTTAGANNIPVTAGSSTCSFTITVAPGAGPAVYTLNCAGATVNGTYTAGMPLTGANTITIPITLTTPGTYSITTAPAVNGMVFANSGTLAAGTTSITLNGTGTPTTAGTNNFTAGTCTIPVTTVAGGGPAVGTLDGGPAACNPATVNGTYYAGVALTSGNNVQVQVDVTTGGTYNITAAAAGAGFGFSGTGTVPVGNNQPITLNFTGGPPTAAGSYTFTVTFGSSTCTFVVNVLSSDYFPRTANSNWSYEYDDNSDPTDTLLRKALSNTISALGNPFTIFMADDGGGFDSSGYYRRNGADYFEWFNWQNYLNGITAPAWAEYIMLKDNLAAGSPAWKTGATQVQTASGPVYLRFSYRILQKDVPITVTTSLGAITYQNVIVVEEKIDGSADGTNWIDLSTAGNLNFYGKSYYAKGVGLIMFEAFDASNAPLFKQELRRRNVF